MKVGGGARGGAPFSARGVLFILLFGAAAFLLTLYLIGAGETGRNENDGAAHAYGRGLAGYCGFAQLLEARGYEVGYSRSAAQLDDETLLVLTPPLIAEADDIAEIIDRRRYDGPTLVILPKWIVSPVPQRSDVEAGDGWVMLTGSQAPGWAADFLRARMVDIQLDERDAAQARWRGLGLEGPLPRPDAVQSVSSGQLVPLVRDGRGQDLVSFWDDGGYYPVLAELAEAPFAEEGNADEDLWPVVIVAEPDLVNNYGMADRERAMLALGVVEAALDGYDLPITFDLTLNGLGRSANLLTLAFTPPFLAATLCLVLAALVVGWRAFRRFGPALAEAPAFAFGKRQLAMNGAALIQRSRRLHLLGPPYAAILRARVVRLLGLRQAGDREQVEAEIDRMLARRGIEPAGFALHAQALREARSAQELLRQAHALKQIERKLEP